MAYDMNISNISYNPLARPFMKQLFITVLACLTCLVPAWTNAEPKLDIALEGGANTATLSGDNHSNRYGFSGGLTVYHQWLADHRFSLGGESELLYTPRGADAMFEGELVGRSRQHYVDIMIAVRPEMHLDQVSLYLLLGGGVNLLVSANKENASGAKQDITSDLRRIDVALLGGAGLAVHLPDQELGPFHFGSIFLEARHDLGLVDTDPAGGGLKNRSSSLMLGLSIVVGDSSSPGAMASAAE
jgi:hypothetical protein